MNNINLINELQNRGFIKEISHANLLENKLKSGQKFTVYCGFDLTAKSLHIGSLIPIMTLRWWLNAGHKIIIILGSGTTKIGDPSDKNETRKILSTEEIEENKKSILSCIGQFIELSDDNITILDNNQWLSKINYIDFLRDIGYHFSINKMIAIDFVKRRLENEQFLSFIEFNYMLIQAYDFLYLYERYNCEIQIGGSDQWGNIIQGIELIQKKHHDAEVFGMTINLVTKSDGTKMGKSASGAIWLKKDMLNPFEYFQYFRNTDDNDVIKFLKLFTELSLNEINKYELLDGEKLNYAKEILAFEVTKICHGEEIANECLTKARNLFSNIIDDIIEIQENIKIIEIIKICMNNEKMSNSDAKRLIQQGAIKINDTKIEDEHYFITHDSLQKMNIENHSFILSAGKHHKAAFRLK